MAFPLSLLYQLNLKIKKMKQLQNLEGAFLYNIRRTLYAAMVIILVVSVPLLSWIELSHKEDQSENRTEITKDQLSSKSTIVLFQKQS